MNFLLTAIVEVLDRYRGQEPLAAFLKQYFRTKPKLGSRDRKAITEAVYLYYRCAAFVADGCSPIAVIGWAMQRCGSTNRFLATCLAQSAEEQRPVAPTPNNNNFWNRERFFSDGVSAAQWEAAMFRQPALFIRTRKCEEQIPGLLSRSEIPFQPLETLPEPWRKKRPGGTTGQCLRLPNGTRLAGILPEHCYVVQDWASQAVMSVAVAVAAVARAGRENQKRFSVWDVCAGAGGKSIFWKDHYPKDELLVTDIRKKILKNLRERFQLYGIDDYQLRQADVGVADPPADPRGEAGFDFIICDVPCSGSGTWSRTPEQFYFFQEKMLWTYPEKQYAISFQAQRRLRPGGLLFYITCSVFREENEAIIARLTAETDLSVEYQELVNGFALDGDALFIAVLKKSRPASVA